VDLKSERGRQIALELLGRADVLIENLTPGVMDCLGLGYEAVYELNDRLIYASGSGYGTQSPYRDLPGWDLLIQAVSGLTSTTGPASMPPTRMSDRRAKPDSGNGMSLGPSRWSETASLVSRR
jgi:crotonobetainyl-CoA:carnitine CoA-transferase CaiB-like acyl-CoA transferase